MNSLTRSIKILSENENVVDEALKEKIKSTKFIAIKELAECYQLLALTDGCEIPRAIKSLEYYISLEQDLLLKENAIKQLNKLKNTIYICRTA